jgi:hypothetical protein
MVNLLPPAEKVLLISSRRKRANFLLGGGLVIIFLCLVLILGSVYFYLLGNLIYEKVLFQDTQKKNNIEDFDNTRDIVQSYNKLINVTNLFYDEQVYMEDALRRIATILESENIVLESLTLDNRPKNIVYVAMAGLSKKRSYLLDLQKNLNSSQDVSLVYIPPESWVKQEDIRFHITFEMLQNKH